MKAIQIKHYSRKIDAELCDIPKPEVQDSEVLIKVKAARESPGTSDTYRKCQTDSGLSDAAGTGKRSASGTAEKAGRNVRNFKPGDRVYTQASCG